MSRIDLLGRYPELNADEVSELIAQRTSHIDLNEKITPYNGDKEWEERVKEQWWARNYAGKKPRGSKPKLDLRNTLLQFGGCEVVLPVVEPDIVSIGNRGQLWDNTRIQFREMTASRCHENASILWYKGKVDSGKSPMILCTGYALSEDGFWRQHSWIINVNAKDTKIVETTSPRLAYFGFGLTYKESERFVNDNLLY